jgi:Spy/CpxP family protein refolding chaperone
MKKLTVLLAVTALACSLINTNAYACGPCGQQGHKCPINGAEHHPGCPLPPSFTPEQLTKMMTERQASLETQLGLTKEQKAKTQVILQNKIKEIVPIVTELKAKKAELKAMEESKFQFAKKCKEEALKKTIGDLRQTKRAAMEKYHQEFEAVLTDAQKQKLKEIIAQHPRYQHTPGQSPCGCAKDGGCKLQNEQSEE